MIPLLSLQHVSKTYTDGTKALCDVTFDIETGEFVGVIGPSGSGKSTLLHIMGFLDRHSSGTYRFDGRTMDAYGSQELAHVRNREMGFVFQSFNLLPRATVYENVILPLYYSDVPESKWKKLSHECIELVGLEHRTTHLSHELSGGEKQRVAIARALVMSPRVVFADEPTGNLDRASGKAIMSLLTKLHKNGHTVILITHDAQIAAGAERTLSIEDGRLIHDTNTP